MKILFIPAKIKDNINRARIELLSSKLPKNIAIAYSIQYENLAKEIKIILSKNHKITSLTQILGCSKPKFNKFTNAILLIGSGRFHAISLALETGLPIYILKKESLEKVSEEEVKKIEKIQKASYLKFLNAKNIGIIISLKPGQEKFKRALDLTKKFKNKKYYLFLANNINSNEFENYKIDSWVNTACPRLDMDSNSLINISKLMQNL